MPQLAIKSAVTTLLSKAKYVSPFYWLKRGGKRVARRVFHTDPDRVMQNSVLIYVLYRGGLVVFRQVRRNGLAGLTRPRTLWVLGGLIVASATMRRYSIAAQRQETADLYNDMVYELEGRGDPLGTHSTPLTKRPVPSRTDTLRYIIRTDAGRARTVLSRLCGPRIAAARRLREVALSAALRVDIGVTRIEAWVADDSLDPSTVPKPLRDEWGMDDPDEVEYPLLNRTR